MADGRFHDQITVVVGSTILLPGIIVPGASPIHLLVGAVAFIISGIWFSPDLDLRNSRPSRRWGPLRVIWFPLWLLGHRSWLSHGWFIGSFFRLLWICLLTAPVWVWILHNYGTPPLWVWGLCWSAFIGFIFGGDLHVIIDVFTSEPRSKYEGWKHRINEGPR